MQFRRKGAIFLMNRRLLHYCFSIFISHVPRVVHPLGMYNVLNIIIKQLAINCTIGKRITLKVLFPFTMFSKLHQYLLILMLKMNRAFYIVSTKYTFIQKWSHEQKMAHHVNRAQKIYAFQALVK